MCAAAVAVAALGTAAAVAGGSAAAGSAGGTVVIRAGSDWPNFNLFQNTIFSMTQYLSLAYDRLVAFGPGWKEVPYLATSWKLSPAVRPRQVTFTLGKDAKCPDGTPITALVVLNSFKTLISFPKSSNFLLDYFGPGPYHLKADRAANTFTFRTETPYSSLLRGFGEPGSSIVCPAGLQALAADRTALDAKMYGSGPYDMVSSTHADQATFQLRPEWKWGPAGTTAKDLPGTVVVKVITDETTAANLLLTGGLNFGPINGTDTGRLDADSSLQHDAVQQFYPAAMMFNQFPNHPVTNDEKLRAALMTAVDPQKWIQAAYSGSGIPVSGLLVPGEECYDASYQKIVKQYGPTPNIDKAKQMLAAAGYTLSGGRLSKNGQPVRLRLVTSSSTMGSGGEYLQTVFNDLGIDVDLANSVTTYAPSIVAGNFDVGVALQTAPFPDPTRYVFVTAGPPTNAGGRNRANTGVGDQDLQRAVLRAVQRPGKTACPYWDEMQKIYYQKHYVMFLGATKLHYYWRGITFPSRFYGSAAWVEPYAMRLSSK
jgi:peptide/nickel transport system substrate-binding protein